MRACRNVTAPGKRLKAWLRRPAPDRDSYVSDVTNPDDRRFIPRR